MKYSVLLIFVGEYLLVNSWRLGSQKVWLPDLEYTTKSNWIDDRVPTKNSRIKFPLEIRHSVGLPLTGNLIFSGVELSTDGSLLLPLNGGLQFSESKGKGNGNNDVFEWKWKGPFYWMDPDNWSGSNKAVPHVEKIPCGTDMVILPPNNHSLSIKLPSVDVNVKEIKIGNNTPLEPWDWQEVMGGREFINSHWSVKYSGLPYCDTDDCLCRHNTDINDLMVEVCEIERPRCQEEEIACLYPIEVEGHCCSYCGGRLTLEANHHNFPLLKLKEIANEALKNYYEISHHVRITLNENVEVLVAENGIYTGIKSAEAIDTLQRIFSEKGIKILSTAVTGAALKGSPISTILGPLFGTPVVIILLMLLGIPYFGYSYKEVYAIFRASVREGNLSADDPGKGGNFGFARFENVPEGEVQLASAVIPEDEIDSDDDDDEYGDGKRFENPLYRSRRREPVENIIDIDGAVSLADLEGRVNSHKETNMDSD